MKSTEVPAFYKSLERAIARFSSHDFGSIEISEGRDSINVVSSTFLGRFKEGSDLVQAIAVRTRESGDLYSILCRVSNFRSSVIKFDLSSSGNIMILEMSPSGVWNSVRAHYGEKSLEMGEREIAKGVRMSLGNLDASTSGFDDMVEGLSSGRICLDLEMKKPSSLIHVPHNGDFSMLQAD